MIYNFLSDIYLNYKMNTQNNNQNKAENTEEKTKPSKKELIRKYEGLYHKQLKETEKLAEENKKLSEELESLKNTNNDIKVEWNKEQDNYKSNKKYYEEEIELLRERINSTEKMFDNVNDELQREKENRKTDRKLWCEKIHECDDLMDALEKTKEKTVRKKKEPVIEYLETKEFYLDGTFDTPTQKGYMPIDAESYINHMKIKDVKEIIEITLSYNQEQSPHLMDLSTETQEDERWIIKKTSRTAKKTEEEIKKDEENIDFNTNCQSCIYNGVKGSMRPCKKAGTLMRGTRRICKTHNKNADTHLAKYVGFTVEMGTHLGWYGEPETYHQEQGKGIKEDWVKPSRK